MKFEQICSVAQQVAQNGTTWLLENYIACAAIGLLASYSYVAYQIYQTNKIIDHQHAWSNWQHGKSLEQLFIIPQVELEEQLLFAFQHSHIDQLDPTNFMYSLIVSYNNLQLEIDLIGDQIRRYEWIATCRCLRLFGIDTDELQCLKNKQKKLLFMKHIFASWCARYKIEKMYKNIE